MHKWSIIPIFSHHCFQISLALLIIHTNMKFNHRREGPQGGGVLSPCSRGREIARAYMETYDPRVPD